VAINAPLVWSANPEGGTPASYDVRFGVVNPPGFAINVATTSYNPAKLFNQLYYWQVKAYNAQGESDWTVVRDFTTATGIPVLTYPGVDAIGIPEQLTFTWGAIAGVSGYKIKIGTTSGGSQVANMVPCATNSYVRAVPLAYNTLHFWSVYSVNGAQEVQSLERSFTTREDPTIYVFPHTQSFDGTTFPPANWLNVKTGGTGTGLWDRQTTGSSPTCSPYSGAAMARFNAYDYSSGTRGVLVTPPLNFISAHYKVNFWMFRDTGYSGNADRVIVYYNPSPNLTGATVLGTINRSTTLAPLAAAGWNEYTFNMPTGSTGPAYLLFEGVSEYGNNMFVDHIIISEIPQFPVFEITPSSRNFGDVQIGTTTAPTVFTVRNAGAGTLIINPPISITGTDAERFILTDTNSYPKELTANQTMTVSVAFQPGTIGDKVASLRVVDNIDVKQERLFGLSGKGVDNTVYNLPKIFTFTPATDVNGWMVFASSPAVSGLWSLPNANLAGGTAPELHHHYPSSGVSNQWTRLVSPPIAVSGLAQVTIKFRHWFDVYSTGLNLQFQYSYNAVDWTPLWNVNATTNLGPEELTFPITMAKADRLYLSWYTFGNQYNIDSWDIDNIRILPNNTQINQATAVAGVANVAVPPIIDESNSNTINASVNITNLTPPNALVNVSIGYADYSLYNAGLSFVLSGTTFGGTTVVVTHDLGFIPVQIAYRIGTGAWIMVMAQPSWTTTTVTIVIPAKMGKNINDAYIVFPQQPNQTLPVELASFTATFDVSMFVKIAWVTASETNHLGYNILRGDSNNVGNAIQLNQNVITPADGVALGTQMSYKFIDNEIYNNETYYYWLESVDLDGTSNLHGPITVLVTLDPEDPGTPPIPLFTKLMEAYPNPFNPSTKISYSLKEAGKVRIEVYNVKGQMIRTYDNDHSTPGYYHILWDGKDTSGRNVSSGLYLYRMISGNYRESKKMVLAK
ncbi:MAG: choice-of-anchor D domain-containing protein, partial [Candidatus Cloacimonadaceae bacterium]|nr:choice-of-anchor D domain-containing protein [Candidatus Cloacimonadaceae bacterium]